MINFIFLIIGLTCVLLSVMEYINLGTKTPKSSTNDVTKRMMQIGEWIASSAYKCVNTQYVYLLAIVPLLIGVMIVLGRYYMAAGIGLGVTAGIGCLYYVLSVALQGNILTSVGAMSKNGLNDGFKWAYASGRTIGTFILGIACLIVSIFFFISKENQTDFMIATALGVSVVSIFARIAGGIFTKAADIGSDLVGKVMYDLPEDSPRNPGVIADNVGDNIGDCIGATADILETFVACAAVGLLFVQDIILTIPLLSTAIGSLIAINMIQDLGMNTNAQGLGNKILTNKVKQMLSSSMYISAIVFALMLLLIVQVMPYINFPNLLQDGQIITLSISFIAGTGLMALLLLVTTYYTSKTQRPVNEIAHACTEGPSMNIIIGYSISLEAAFMIILPVSIIALAVYFFSGLNGLVTTALVTLGYLPAIMTMDGYGPIADNAGGIATMSDAPEHTRDNTDILDSIGNLTKALTKGYASGVGIFVSILLISLYTNYTQGVIAMPNLSLYMLSGILIGGACAFIFPSFIIRSVYSNATYMLYIIIEKIKNLGDKPIQKDYYTGPVGSLAERSVQAMLMPVSIILIPFIVYLGLYYLINIPQAQEYMLGSLIGAISSGALLSVSMTIGGAAWDNGKKLVEDKLKAILPTYNSNFTKALNRFRDSDSADTSESGLDEEKAQNIIAIAQSIHEISTTHIAEDQKALAFDNIMQVLAQKTEDLCSKVADAQSSNLDLKAAFGILKTQMTPDDASPINQKLNNVFLEYSKLTAVLKQKEAAVVGDTLGDPLKDAAGTALNVFIKMICILAIAITLLMR